MAVSGIRRRSEVSAEALPGRKAETDRVREGISEGFHPAEPGGIAPGGAVANGDTARCGSSV